ncbi:hypothetical protein [Labilibacter marinus]|uniref:hypothetical protein n=1 Tax=Labilibacter marinus TaxID=1477105 RepID=UPI000836CA2A|nr:hypothetical protein [Labilibacter marinus]
MRRIQLFKIVTFLCLLVALSAGCERGSEGTNIRFLVEQDSIETWLLSDKIAAFTEGSKHAELKNTTGLTKNDYLKVIEGQVKVMQTYQNEKGGIVDPVRKKELYYTTPCYAHSVSVLASSGYTKDTALIESGMKALDNACGHLKNQWAPGNHGDFFTWPVLFAYRHLKSFADSTRLKNWTESIAGIKPEKFYAYHRNYSMNWNLVHAAGEFLRYKEGFTDVHYVDTCLHHQKKHITAEGMYKEWGDPLAYDLFSRHYLTGMLALGYQGEHLDYYSNNMTKGAWMSLFMQSPTGELPTGYRSTHHIWNEAEQAMLFEIFAQQYKLAGQDGIAGSFKRAAMLSLQNIKGWIRPDGSGYAVKNKFPIEKRQGYESYTAHSTYNMLATSMLAQAYEFAANIDEGICPADMGGYILPVKSFHKVFASLNGSYIEYDTKGDQKYNPTGILRVHLKGTSPQLGPSDGIAAMWNQEGTSIALGPSWQNNEGDWISLAQQKVEPTEVKVLEESKDRVAFKVVYVLTDSVKIQETISIENNVAFVKDSIVGVKGNTKLTWPMLVDDGETKSEVNSSANTIRLMKGNEGIQLKVLSKSKPIIHIPNQTYNHRNGMAKVAEIQIDGNVIEYSLSLP